jgi:hypothetical protein
MNILFYTIFHIQLNATLFRCKKVNVDTMFQLYQKGVFFTRTRLK